MCRELGCSLPELNILSGKVNLFCDLEHLNRRTTDIINEFSELISDLVINI